MIFELENIKVFQLYQRGNFLEYIELQKMMKPKDEFLGKKAASLGELEFGQVSRIKRIMNKPTSEGLAEAFELIFGVRKNQYENALVTDFFYAINHIKNEIVKLINREVKMLSSEPDLIMSMAGSDRMNKFKEMNTLIKIGKMFGKSPMEVERWTYSTVFTLTLHAKTLDEITNRYNELKKKR